MRLHGFIGKTHTPVLALILSLGLVFSFGLHAVQVEHAHFNTGHTHGDEQPFGLIATGEYMHMAEKKLLAVVVFMGISLLAFLSQSVSIWQRLLLFSRYASLVYRRYRITTHRVFSYVCAHLERGILHSKAY